MVLVRGHTRLVGSQFDDLALVLLIVPDLPLGYLRVFQHYRLLYVTYTAGLEGGSSSDRFSSFVSVHQLDCFDLDFCFRDAHRLVHFLLDYLASRWLDLVEINCTFNLRRTLTLHAVTLLINIFLISGRKRFSHVLIPLVLFVD